MVAKTWNIKEINEHAAISLQKELNGTRASIYRLLVARGLDSYSKVASFFKPSLEQLHSPWLMKDMDKAVERIIHAIHNNEKILLFGDYDVDGTTSVSLMYRFLSEVYNREQLLYYIPDRYHEGYGLNQSGIEYGIEHGASLIITVDCGITSNDLIREASAEGEIDFIICDHHLPPDEIPCATAVLNPKQARCDYPFKELCGCGVCFKLIQAITERLQLPEEQYLAYLDLVVLATSADVVPIQDENRVLCHFGLAKANQTPCSGIQALKEAAGYDRALSMRDIAFGIAPMINAAGRIAHAATVVSLFTTDDAQKAKVMAEQLVEFNKIRKDHDKEVKTEAISLLEEQASVGQYSASVVYKHGWHQGVLGIVASRLIELYYRPTIVLTDGDEYISGSARSIPGYNIYNAIDACKEYLIRFGGHEAAAGLTLAKENLVPFTEKFDRVVADTLLPEIATPVIHIDIELDLSEIDFLFFNTINRLRPFGHKNPMPIFLSKQIEIHPQTRIVAENHVRFIFKVDENKWITGIAFNQKVRFLSIDKNTPLDIVYQIEKNSWNGQKSLQLKVIDFRPSTLSSYKNEI